ncbi:MAG TPA: DUF2842 domain-containing protein [Rhizomicrobium sp.]|nr:DUF2842 domain-containing protein [Rhizomicrobium sp.]
MTPRVKKLVGTLLILLWLPVYALAAMGLGVHLLPHAHWIVAALYYALAGSLWAVPVGLLFPWMYREPR